MPSMHREKFIHDAVKAFFVACNRKDAGAADRALHDLYQACDDLRDGIPTPPPLPKKVAPDPTMEPEA